MTSTDFASKYRLLKNVATRGARSFLAQQVALGRMVMVHYLDSETPEQRSATLARLEALKPPAREKLLEIVDVDGSPVAVPLFISSFVDFTTWLDHVSVPVAAPQTPPPVKMAPHAPGEFTRAFSKMETPAAPPVMASRVEEHTPQRQAPAAPPPPPPEAAKPAGDFTRIFGKVDSGEPRRAPASRAEPTPIAPKREDVDSPTLIIEAHKAAPRPAPSATPPSPASTEGGAGFTAIFGRIGETRLPDELPAETPKPAAPTPGAGRVMQPMPVPDFHQSPGPLAPPPSAPPPQNGGGEFTQLFQRLSATSAPPGSMAPSAAPPMSAPPSFGLPSEPPRSLDQPPRPDLMPPPMPSAAPPIVLPPPSLGAPTPPMPSFGGSLPAPMLGMPSPPISPSGPRLPEVTGLPNVQSNAPNAAATLPSPWGVAPPAAGAGSMFGGSAAQSEYTRILGRVAVPPPPPIAIQPPAAASAAASSQKASKSMVPLIIALGVVLLLTVAIVAYVVFRK